MAIVRRFYDDKAIEVECEKCYDEEGSESCLRSSHSKMRIEFQMSYNQLDALVGGDEALIPILRDKGMPVYIGTSHYGSCIKGTDGTFGWHDNGAIRTFWWEGTQPLKKEEEHIVCSCGSTTLLMEYGNLRCVSCNRIIPNNQIFIPTSTKKRNFKDITAEDREITFEE